MTQPEMTLVLSGLQIAKNAPVIFEWRGCSGGWFQLQNHETEQSGFIILENGNIVKSGMSVCMWFDRATHESWMAIETEAGKAT